MLQRARGMRTARRYARTVPLCVGCLMIGLAPVEVEAKRPKDESQCEKMRPEQRLSDDQERALQTVLQGGMAGVASASAEVDSSNVGSTTFQVLSQDDLARAWYIYQVCVMKEAELLSDDLAEQMLAKVFGLDVVRETTETITVVDAETGGGWGSL